ncbi:MAG: glycosyltransferase family 4 protein [Rhodobacteraceae bacterium]|nr:glycosyltransferase family 4 protein [Paracoccaceae bacterium]
MRQITYCLRLARRFLHMVRDEGWVRTWSHSRVWLGHRWRGRHPSIAPEVTGTLAYQGAWDVQAFWQESAVKSGFQIASPPALMQRRKVALIGDLNLPQCRKYRVEQLGEIFQEAGVDYIFAHHEDLPRCMDILQDASHLMLYRLRSSPTITRHLYEARRLRLPILYDIDDPLFSVPAYASYGNMAALPPEQVRGFLAGAPFYAEVMNLADAISVSTPALQDHARAFTNRPVFLRRNFADRTTLGVTPRHGPRDGSGFRICFASGSHGHEVDFAEISPDLARFLAHDPARRLVILGHFDRRRLPQALRGQIECHPFAGYASYLGHLAGCDAAVMPLADDLFNHCKSAVRVIDAASVGLPSLVGRVSDMQAVVEDGVTGRVLGPGGDWAAALEDLARAPGLAREMGRQARQRLEQRWTARLDAPVIDPAMLRWVCA